MHLALKRTPASDATRLQRACCTAIKVRLVSQYCHGGIVIDGWLYHATAEEGLGREPFDMAKANDGWDFFDLGSERDTEALFVYSVLEGTGYDWFSLLAFVLPGRISDARRLYCFEWCALAMGLEPYGRVTPEILLATAVRCRRKGLLCAD